MIRGAKLLNNLKIEWERMRNKGAHFKSKTLRFSIVKNREMQNDNKANENKKNR